MTESTEATFARVARILTEQLGVSLEQIKPETRLDALGADSLDSVEILMALEDEFEIEIADDAAERITTVQQIIECVTGAVRG